MAKGLAVLKELTENHIIDEIPKKSNYLIQKLSLLKNKYNISYSNIIVSLQNAPIIPIPASIKINNGFENNNTPYVNICIGY